MNRKPYLKLSPELSDGMYVTFLPLDESGYKSLATSLDIWKHEFGDDSFEEDFSISLEWMTDEQFESLPDL